MTRANHSFLTGGIWARLIMALTLIFSMQAMAEDEIYTGLFSDKAVSGYDPVAYFTEGKPVKGSDKFSTRYKGAAWYFSSEENKNLFLESPEKYAPQYGGYCAWAVAHGKTASADPRQWNIEDGKLYLNYNGSVQKKWLKDKKKLINEADDNWPKVIN
ncbi:YHS domain-containing (seleno)protein [Endozoicomonas sp. 8E]|uniref:YHS domain-containing (seleno)protein n=1 Tax=Endozoicomonas sp. 8E TaxID=3035692 RepID=UPI00293942D6|nr:YHS domain-containing (seleno)protein [Endozoicomonas sp. 8E]WOG26694.1 YHS domain-containing (seleno)protein [Endozoicomonas sp. 8E]